MRTRKFTNTPSRARRVGPQNARPQDGAGSTTTRTRPVEVALQTQQHPIAEACIVDAERAANNASVSCESPGGAKPDSSCSAGWERVRAWEVRPQVRVPRQEALATEPTRHQTPSRTPLCPPLLPKV
jgi:hypothetical protein